MAVYPPISRGYRIYIGCVLFMSACSILFFAFFLVGRYIEHRSAPGWVVLADVGGVAIWVLVAAANVWVWRRKVAASRLGNER